MTPDSFVQCALGGIFLFGLTLVGVSRFIKPTRKSYPPPQVEGYIVEGEMFVELRRGRIIAVIGWIAILGSVGIELLLLFS